MLGNLSQETDQFMQAWKTDVKINDDYVSLWFLPLGGGTLMEITILSPF